MNYDELREQQREYQRRNNALSRELQQLKSDMDSVDNEISSMNVSMSRTVALEKDAARRTFLTSEVQPYLSALTKLESQVTALKADYEHELSAINEQNVYEELKSREGIPSDLETSLAMVKESITNDLGDRFSTAYISQIEKSPPQLNNEELAVAIRRLSLTLEKVPQISADLTPSMVERVYDTLDNLSRSRLENAKPSKTPGGEENSEVAAAKAKKVAMYKMAAVTVGGVALAAPIVLPIYVILLSVKCVMNIRKGVLLSEVAKDCFTVSASIDRVDEHLRSKAKEQVKKLTDQLNAEYNVSMQELESRIQKAREDIENAEYTAHSDFTFDEASAYSKFDIPMQSLQERRRMINERIISGKEKQEELMELLKEVSEQLKGESGAVLNKYLNYDTLSKERLFDGTFLLDFNDKGKPEYFNINTSVLFNYDDIDYVGKFIRLICAQLRSRLSPSSASVQIWDPEYLGMYALQFYKTEKSLFSITENADDLKTKLIDMTDQLMRRKELITKQYAGGITEYNKVLLELESVPESYYFLFVVNPSDALIQDNAFHQLTSFGAEVGVYTIIFIHRDEMDKKYIPLVRKVSKFHKLTGSKLQSLAQDRVLEQLSQFE